MGMTEIPNPFMHHPLFAPGFTVSHRIICIAGGSHPQPRVVRKDVAHLTIIVKRVIFETFVKNVGHTDVDERRQGVALTDRGLYTELFSRAVKRLKTTCGIFEIRQHVSDKHFGEVEPLKMHEWCRTEHCRRP